jgi:pimeloyl-ACP methyl ester carboxylesterase
MSANLPRRSLSCVTPSCWHRMSYVEWGDPRNQKVVICVHGLTRCARDFDFLAAALCAEYRVVCPDVPGRGESEWLKNPMEYTIPVYANDMAALIARLDVERVSWVGTSLGGLVGMALAALPHAPIERLVLNDVGPVLAAASLLRIGAYVGNAPVFPSLAAAELYIRTVSAPFGPHSDAEWRFLTENVVRRQGDGTYRMHYDPAIALAFAVPGAALDMGLWHLYDAIRCPTLVLRGELSDLLTRETAEAMTRRGPKAKLVEIAGVGHAPTLIHADQIEVVRRFLAAR